MEIKKIQLFYNKVKEIADSDGYLNIEILSEVGELMNDMSLSTSDLQDIVDNYTNDYYIDTFVKPQLELELEELNKEKQELDLLQSLLNSYGTDAKKLKKALKDNGYDINKIYNES